MFKAVPIPMPQVDKRSFKSGICCHVEKNFKRCLLANWIHTLLEKTNNTDFGQSGLCGLIGPKTCQEF